MIRRRPSGVVGLTLAVTSVLLSLVIPSSAAKHTIKQGDSLWKIAAKHKTTVSAICRANGISENATLKLGTTITVPSKQAAKPAAKATAAAAAKPRVIQRTVYMHATHDNVVLRSKPSTSAQKLGLLNPTMNLKAMSVHGSWVKVSADGRLCGYVSRSLVAHGPGTSASSETSAKAPQEVSTESETAGDQGLIRTALNYRGTRYRRGGTSRGGFDCSGFTRYIYAKYGVGLPHSSSAQASIGTPVSKSELREGDLVFFQTYRKGISHVGIYIGNNSFVHAASNGRGVTVDSLSSGYYAPRYRGARRVK